MLLFFVLWKIVYCCGNFLDVNDILNVDYMPGSLLLLEGSDSVFANVSEDRNIKHALNTGGSIKEAYDTMGFHRKKMNDYLCRNFLADQILSEMSLTRVTRRLGTASSSNLTQKSHVNGASNHKNGKFVSKIKDDLLLDEGSSNYKHWLTKSTTLEDIYRRYEEMQDRDLSDLVPGDGISDTTIQDDYEGEVTAFEMQTSDSVQRGAPAKVGYGNSAVGNVYANTGITGGIGHSGYGGSGHDVSHDYAPQPQPQHIQYHHNEDTDYADNGKNDKEIALTDLFEIALTAIAFLSFGCFVLQVIMCVTAATNNSTTTMIAMTMMPMTMDNGGNGNGDTDMTDINGGNGDDDGSEAVRIRYKRNSNSNYNTALNELARRTLLSIESAIIALKDDGNCLRQTLCENNKYSRSLADNQKLWIPVWSFGLSWLTGRLMSQSVSAVTVLDSLKSSILGLGNANCKLIYNNCNLQQFRKNRRRRRKKRTTGTQEPMF